VLLTMHDDPSAVLQALETGVAGYVLKDNSFEELVQAVHNVATGGTFVTPAIRAKLRTLQREGRPAVPLSPREREVIRLIALGNSSKEIARIMAISPRTVDTYRSRSMEKLGLHSLADVVRYAVQAGMVG
jgi:DNA-binding NarL/FixJ family response regulator